MYLTGTYTFRVSPRTQRGIVQIKSTCLNVLARQPQSRCKTQPLWPWDHSESILFHTGVHAHKHTTRTGPKGPIAQLAWKYKNRDQTRLTGVWEGKRGEEEEEEEEDKEMGEKRRWNETGGRRWIERRWGENKEWKAQEDRLIDDCKKQNRWEGRRNRVREEEVWSASSTFSTCSNQTLK